MAILHGSWLLQPRESEIQADSSRSHHAVQAANAKGAQAGCLLVWGEVWRRLDPIVVTGDAPLPHPFAMDAAELIQFVRSLVEHHSLSWPNRLPLDQLLSHLSKSPSDPWKELAIALPTYTATQSAGRGRKKQIALFPQHSGTAVAELGEAHAEAPDPSARLHPWQVMGLCLQPNEAIQLLHSLPLNLADLDDSFLGGDLRFWSHVARWNLDLLARSKYLPILEQTTDGNGQSHWLALLDNASDQVRLEHYVTHMPLVCRTLGAGAGAGSDSSANASTAAATASTSTAASKTEAAKTEAAEIDSSSADAAPESAPAQDAAPGRAKGKKGTSAPQPEPEVELTDARVLLFSFLNQTVDAQVRRVATTIPLPASPLTRDLPLREWLQSLGKSSTLAAEAERVKRLRSLLNTWLAPVQRQLTQKIALFRTSFKLVPPAQANQEWTLEYGLQTLENDDFWLGAEVIWKNPVERLQYQGRMIEQPQETLLAGLGLAARLYPVIEPSLQETQPTHCSLHPLQVYEFIKSTGWQLQDSGLGVVLPPSLSNRDGWANRLGLAVRAETPKGKKKQGFGLQSLLNFRWELTIGGQRLSKEEFESLVALNTPLVEINGEWVELRPQDIKAAQTFFESRKDQMTLSLEDALRISTGDTQTIEKLPVVDFEASGSLRDLLDTLTTGNQNIALVQVPESFQGELRPYQTRGMSWLKFLSQWGLGACLADDMGLGKTIQLIALLLHLKEQDALTKPSLLVCPTSVLGNWEREVRRFAPDLRVMVHHGDKRSQGKAFATAIQAKDLVITSYALVYRDEKTLKGVDWQGIVLDEAQNIKNAESKQSQVVRQLEADFRIALTGTPIENRLAELWSIIDFLNPGYLGPRNFFQRRFAVPIERYGDTDSLQTLRSLVQPFILRRLKSDRDIIQDLPDKQEMTIFCGLSETQADLYQHLVDQSLASIEAAEGIQRHGMILALLTRLKQVCNHPALLGDESGNGKGGDRKSKKTSSLTPASPHFQTLSGKLQRLEEMLDELLAEGDRALIFTQFAEWGKLMKAYLEKQFGREVLFLYGNTSKEQREAMVDRFQNDPQAPRLFILSLKAGGVGLNLTRANHVFHFDRWWNPAVENQATDRAFRIGQTRNVQVHKFVCSGTLEERINELIESKKALSEQVVGSGENWLTDFDTDQLRNLLLLDRNAVIEDE